MRKWSKAAVSLIASSALAMGMCVPTAAFAAGGLAGTPGSNTNWEVPTAPMKNTVDVDGKTYKVITTWANAWALSGPDYLGVSNSGPLNQQGGGAGSSTLADAQNSTMLGIWASAANEVPNAYNWNYFYNLAQSQAGKTLADTAAVDVQNSSTPGFDSESGVWSPFKYRPEIIWTSNSLNAQGVKTYTQLIRDGKYYDGKTATTHEEQGGRGKTIVYDDYGDALDKGSYYIAGDENYNPSVISATNTSAFTFTDSFYELAGLVDQTKSATAGNNADGKVTKDNVTWKTMNALPRTTRYEASAEDPMTAQEAALQVEKLTRGSVYYTLSKIADGTVAKKKVAFLTADPDASTSTATVVAYDFIDQIGGGNTAGKASTAPLVVDQLTGTKVESGGDGDITWTTYTVKADDLAKCDVVFDAAGDAMSADQLKKWVADNASSAELKTDATEKVEYLVQCPAILNGHNYTSEKLIFGIYDIAFIYPELFPNMELVTYWYDKVYHLKSDNLRTALQWGLANSSLPSAISPTDLAKDYDASAVDNKFMLGWDYWQTIKGTAPYNTDQFKTLQASSAYDSWVKGIKKVDFSVDTPVKKTFGDKAFKIEPTSTASGVKYEFSSSDEKVATVDAKGKVKIVAAGSAKITVSATANAARPATKTVKVKIAKAKNPMTVKAKTVKAKSAKKTTVKATKAFKVKKAQGKVTYKKTKGNAKITVSSKGKITVKKGLKAKTYKVKVQVKAKGNANYKSGKKTVTVKVKVK